MKRNSPNDIGSLDDLSRLGEVVIDKRLGKRAAAKKEPAQSSLRKSVHPQYVVTKLRRGGIC